MICSCFQNRKFSSRTALIGYFSLLITSVISSSGLCLGFSNSNALPKSIKPASHYKTHSFQKGKNLSLWSLGVTPSDFDASFLSEAWSSYNVALETSPLLTKSVTAGVILGAADFAGQALENSATNDGEEKNNNGFDIGRVLRFSFFGFILQAPWNHFYYNILDGVLPPTEDPFTTTTGIKVFIDQFVQAPIFTVLIFGFLGILEGKNLEQIKSQLQNDYTDTMVANCKCSRICLKSAVIYYLIRLLILQLSEISIPSKYGVSFNVGKLWVPATMVNIAFCPPVLRVLFLNVVFFFWSIFLSLKLNSAEE